ncbi:Cd(II)/Pb(II)-responsive transcriptional regulator [Noviherbaspirillum galbum]|uniref:Cd(II)/Pb(II)-responsive transcriptional regulator n=1 Tax=Noviherbaspirillum galbum TaxID=2709383 RepID=A0A6B3SNC7_9BURK|nr:Cd(II)/Pb(II)-responsive transcriptional regulator [Noviherbaspirillum galbum]NEX59912.1 Cd(II)/Pb(II)-responsive transcriptional regulator [Noviherbaspirillum galbum]
MRIGELAKRAGTDVETVRYYERSGLIKEPARNTAGYRAYREDQLERLQFIRHCRSLQMSLADIRVLLDLKDDPAAGCEEVNRLLDHHIERIREQVMALRQLETQLTTLRHQCGAPQSIGTCAIMQNLSESAERQECACHDGNAERAAH